MRITTVLGLDFGERRIGVAVSDAAKSMASGLMTIDCKAAADPLDVLAEIIREECVGAIVVGYPLRTDGKSVAGGKTEAVDAFINKLEARFLLPVHREDESFTSQLAAESLRARAEAGFGSGSKGAKRKGKSQGKGNRKGRPSRQEKAAIDRVAACYILQDFLDRGAPA